MDEIEIREAINKILRIRGRLNLFDQEWEPIKAAIDAAQPPDKMDKACAALRELNAAKDDRHSITLYGDGSGSVYDGRAVNVLEGEVGGFGPSEGPAAAIHSLIPPPEPTLENNLETIRTYLCTYGGSKCAGWDDAMDAVAHLRKRLDETKGE